MGLRSFLSRLMIAVLLIAAAWPASMVPAEAAAAAAESQQPYRKEKLHPRLREQVDSAASDAQFTVIIKGRDKARVEAMGFRSADAVAALKAAAARSQTPIVNQLRARGTQVLNRFWLINAVVARVDKPTLQALTNLREVELVLDNFALTAPPVRQSAAPAADGDKTWGLEKIEAERVWNELGVTGQGVRVAVLDTGVDLSHPDLTGKMHSDNPGDPTYPGGWAEFDGDGRPVSGSVPHDSAAHGTHVSGTVLGGSASGTSIGVAPGATLMHGMVLPGGGGTFAQVLAGMQWAVEPTDGDGNPAGERAHVASMSWGAEGLRSEVVEAVRNMYFSGVLPVAAMGNCGEGCVGSPGAVYEAFGIGASAVDDSIAGFSSGAVISKSGWENAPEEWPDQWVKPDISAPGANVFSSVPGGGYDAWDGTSMATPHVSGTAALMLAANPGLTPDVILETLGESSYWDNRYGDARPNIRYGMGRINAYEATARIAYNSGIAGVVTDAATGAPLDQAQVTVEGTNRSARTKTDGSFALVLPPGSYTLKVERFGYQGVMLPPTTVVDGATSRVTAALQPLPMGTIRGRIKYDRTGIGIPGMSLRVQGIPIRIEATTDAEGDYSLRLPVGTYDLQVTGFGFGKVTAGALVAAEGEITVHDVELAALPRVAVVGDFDNLLTNFLSARGYLAEAVDMKVAEAVDSYSAIIVNQPYDADADSFRRLVENADAAGVGLIFLKGYWYGWGIDWLQSVYGDPVSTSFDWFFDGLNGQVVQENPDLLPGRTAGEQFMLMDCCPEVAWFEGYSGDALLDLTNSNGRLGTGVAVKQNANNRHVLMASYGVIWWQPPAMWTPDAQDLFLRAVGYAAKPDTGGARYVMWDLQASPDTVLWSESVSIGVGVKNIGDAAGSKNVQIAVGDMYEAPQNVNLASGAHDRAKFTVQREAVGTYRIQAEHLTASFRVRPPRVTVNAHTLYLPPSGKGKNADPGEPAIPLAGAQVDLVKDGKVISRGNLDTEGRLTFDSTASRDSYTLVVRHYGYGYNMQRNYLLTLPVQVESDSSFTFAPQAAQMAQVDVALTRKSVDHHGSLFISGGALGKTAYQFPVGALVATPGAYRAAPVMAYDVPGAQWAYAGDWADLALAAGRQSYTMGGELRLNMADVRGGQAPAAQVNWSVADGYGHTLAAIYRVTAGAFGSAAMQRVVKDATAWPATVAATAQDVVKPVLTLTNPAGAIEQTGTVGWAERPKAINLPTAEVKTGEYGLQMQSDTGPYLGTLQASASLMLPARSLSRTLVMPGDSFEVTVVFDAGSSGSLSLTEALPAGFRITRESSQPNASFSGSTWTWSGQGRNAYRPGQTIRVTYTVEVDRTVAAGTYALTGSVSHSGASRLVAGPQAMTVVR